MYRIGCVVILLFLAFTGCATMKQSRMDREQAFAMTQIWLQYFDEMNYEKLWEISSDLWKLKSEKKDFIRILNGIRAPLGKVVDRDLQVNTIVPFVKHYPDGNYRKIVFWSKYENKDFAREYILLVKEGERWRILDFWLV